MQSLERQVAAHPAELASARSGMDRLGEPIKVGQHQLADA